MLAKKLIGATATKKKLYVDDVFSTYLYTGNGATQTINNGIDLAGEGGLFWVKMRSGAENHFLFDSDQSGVYPLCTNTTNSKSSNGAFTGFSLNSSGAAVPSILSVNSQAYASWTFRKAPKFFDIVTYTGNGVAGRQIPHELGIAPGMIIIKCTSAAGSWYTWHRSVNNGDNYGALNDSGPFTLNNAKVILGDGVSYRPPTDTHLTISGNNVVNQSGAQYVAYLYAHDDSEDGIIQCGSFVGTGGVTAEALGWEPQYFLAKLANGTEDWQVCDSMRAFTADLTDNFLSPNTSQAEGVGWRKYSPLSTGFSHDVIHSRQYIYLAIRRPNKPPTSGTEVFMPTLALSQGSGTKITTGFPVDLQIVNSRDTVDQRLWMDRLRGVSTTITDSGRTLTSTSTRAEDGSASTRGFDNTGLLVPSWYAGSNMGLWNFRRAPGFLDIVCYPGTGVERTMPHGLGVAPELAIVKQRNGTNKWVVWHKDLGVYFGDAYSGLVLNLANALSSEGSFKRPGPDAGSFRVASGVEINGAGLTYVAYLFATLPGISKVGNYTGNGTSQTIPCGFSTGARFILIKRTDAAGDWYVWDSARGIVAANDPHLSLNTTAAEITTDDSVDPHVSGFIVNQVAATNINVLNGQYIFLAIA